MKLNVSDDSPETTAAPSDPHEPAEASENADADEARTEQKKLARLLMRSDGVYRVILNVPIFKTLKAGDQNGNMPNDRYLKLTALENQNHVLIQLRVSHPYLSFPFHLSYSARDRPWLLIGSRLDVG